MASSLLVAARAAVRRTTVARACQAPRSISERSRCMTSAIAAAQRLQVRHRGGGARSRSTPARRAGAATVAPGRAPAGAAGPAASVWESGAAASGAVRGEARSGWPGALARRVPQGRWGDLRRRRARCAAGDRDRAGTVRLRQRLLGVLTDGARRQAAVPRSSSAATWVASWASSATPLAARCPAALPQVDILTDGDRVGVGGLGERVGPRAGMHTHQVGCRGPTLVQPGVDAQGECSAVRRPARRLRAPPPPATPRPPVAQAFLVTAWAAGRCGTAWAGLSAAHAPGAARPGPGEQIRQVRRQLAGAPRLPLGAFEPLAEDVGDLLAAVQRHRERGHPGGPGRQGATRASGHSVVAGLVGTASSSLVTESRLLFLHAVLRRFLCASVPVRSGQLRCAATSATQRRSWAWSSPSSSSKVHRTWRPRKATPW